MTYLHGAPFDVSGMFLTGSLPSQLGRLTGLTAIDLEVRMKIDLFYFDFVE